MKTSNGMNSKFKTCPVAKRSFCFGVQHSHSLFIILCSVFLLLLLAKNSWAANWYVMPSGGCTYSGNGTASSCATGADGAGAWKGFSNIVWGSNGVKAGDTLYLIVGQTYYEEITMGAGGNSWSAPITISVTGTTGAATIDGQNTRNTPIYTNGHEYIVVDGLRGNAVAGDFDYGIKCINLGDNGGAVYTYDDYVKIYHLEASGSNQTGGDDGGGIRISGGGHYEIAYNYIHGAGPSTLWHASGIIAWCESGTTNYDDTKIHHNMVRYLYHDGIKFDSNALVYNNEVSYITESGHSDSIICQSGSYNKIYNNYIHNSNDQNIYLDNLNSYINGHIYIYNNVINSDPGFGIVLHPEVGDWDDIHIYNNTFAATSATAIRTSGSMVTNLHVQNNYFGINSDNGYYQMTYTSGDSWYDANAYDYNWYRIGAPNYPQICDYNGAKSTLTQLRALSPARETHGNVTSDPKFVSASDFNLQATSPLIGVGVNLYSIFTTDKAGNSRPSSGAWAIGAYEYVGTTPDTTPPEAPSGVTVQ